MKKNNKSPAESGRLALLQVRSVAAASILGFGTVLAPWQAVQAAPVTLCGPNVCYEYDNDPGVNAGILLFGAPTLLGFSNTLQFSPTTFEVDSDNGTSIPGPTVTATFQFSNIWTLNGGEIALITVAESGDYQIVGSGEVNANLRVQIVDQANDNGTPGFPEQIVDEQNFNTSVPTGLPLQEWALTSSVSPAAVFDDLATSVDLQIQNMLQAFSTEGYAYIAKKLLLTVTVEGDPVVIPVPAAAWLFGSALGVLMWVRRRLPRAVG